MADKKKWVGVRLPEEVHTALMRRATTRGMHPTDLAAEFVHDGLVRDGRECDDPEMHIFALSQEARKRDVLLGQLEHLTVNAMRDDDQEALQKIETLCTEAGFDFSVVMDTASRLGNVPAISMSSGKVAEATFFIVNALKDGPMAATQIKDMCKQQGYSASVIQSAKRTAKVASVRRPKKGGVMWTWELTGGQDENVSRVD